MYMGNRLSEKGNVGFLIINNKGYANNSRGVLTKTGNLPKEETEFAPDDWTIMYDFQAWQ